MYRAVQMLCHCGSVSVQSCTDVMSLWVCQCTELYRCYVTVGLSVYRAVQMLCHCRSVSVQSCTVVMSL